MFTPKNIQGALEELYDLCDPDYMVDMLVNYSEEFDDISPALLAKSFQKNAEMISEYRVLSSAGEGIDYQGKVLLNSSPFLISFIISHIASSVHSPSCASFLIRCACEREGAA